MSNSVQTVDIQLYSCASTHKLLRSLANENSNFLVACDNYFLNDRLSMWLVRFPCKFLEIVLGLRYLPGARSYASPSHVDRRLS
jgi:hypothetical protein